MQDNFKYPRIKKIHQVLEKITRFDQKVKILCVLLSKSQILCVLLSHELLYTKHTTHQFTFFIYYLFQDKFKNPKIMKMQQVHQEIQKLFLLFYLNCFLFVIHLNLKQLKKRD